MRITEAEAKKLGIPIPPKAKNKVKRGTPHIWNGSTGYTEVDEINTGSDRIFNELCKAHDLPLPDSEYQFCPTRKFRADYCFDGWLLVEIDGGIYGKGEACHTCGRKGPGAHSSITQMKKDREKDITAILNGFIIIRLLPEEIKDGSGFAIIREVLGKKDEMP